MLLGDDRILEKTSRRSYLGPIRQFLFSDRDDDIRYFLSSDFCRIYSLFSDAILDIVVLDIRDIVDRLFLKDKRYRGYNYFVFQFLFEDTLTIAEFTVAICPYFFLFRGEINAFHFIDDIFRFLAIGADIAYRSCPYLAWDEHEILSSDISLLQASHHQLMPIFSSSCLDIDGITVLLHYFFVQ